LIPIKSSSYVVGSKTKPSSSTSLAGSAWRYPIVGILGSIEEALCDRYLSPEGDKRDLNKISTLSYEGDIEDYMTQMTYKNSKVGLICLAWLA
jgi:hypothetical protein